MTPTQVLIRCDAGPETGAGHAMRCLTLARALAGRGAVPTFASSAGTFETVPALRMSGFSRITLDRPLDPDELDMPGRRWDAIAVDHYELNARHEAAFRRAAAVILVIDDLADRPHDCDILCDQTLGRTEAEYRGLIPRETVTCLGPRYALLRPEFVVARPAALAARAKGGPLSRILVSLGMTDIGEVTAWATKAVLAAGLDAEIAVAVGSNAASLPELLSLADSDPRLKLHPDCADMCALMAGSDIAIGACGTTSWERCVLGLPAIAVVLADNQSLIARNLAATGAIALLPTHDSAALTAALTRLAADSDARIAMSRAAGTVTDGKGAERLAALLMNQIAARRVNADER
jgi:UDP-2,4-diacetamido-2,4,6-trideoxy-beta-L-altropyranose hydrolase